MAAERNPNGTYKRGPLEKGDKIALKYKDEYGDKLLEWFEKKIADGGFPTFQGASVALDIPERTLAEWKKYPYFAEKYEKCISIQQQDAIEGAICDKYNARFTQFLLGAVYGICEKSKLEVAGDKNAPLEIKIVTDD